MTKKILKGFTLLEVLVVISIIGILTSLALLSFEPSQKRARDTQRKSDLKQFQTSLEGFANNNNGLYPSRTTVIEISDSFCTALEIEGACPQDPKEGYSYKYISDGSGLGSNDATKYVLWSRVEISGNYWVICSSGKVGEVSSEPTENTCPNSL